VRAEKSTYQDCVVEVEYDFCNVSFVEPFIDNFINDSAFSETPDKPHVHNLFGSAASAVSWLVNSYWTSADQARVNHDDRD
jgi:hypothetical protein